MRVQDIMTDRVQTVALAMGLGAAARLMRTKRIRHLVVTDGERVRGVLSDGDILRSRATAPDDSRCVADAMSVPAVTVTPATTVRRAANIMRGQTIGCLVVTDRDRAVGVVTTSDLLDLIGRGFDRTVARTTRWTLKHRVPHRKARRSPVVW
jgi:CBS domain-containing protein